MGQKIITRSLRTALRDLREQEPTLVPVRFSRRRLKGVWGYCQLIRDARERPHHFVIVLDSRLPEALVIEWLIHEWAHAVSWQEGRVVDDHGPEWGIAYARLYQQMVAE